MNWNSFKLGIPIGVLGGLLAVSDERIDVFNALSLIQLVNLFVNGFIKWFVAFLVGLKTPTPWDGAFRRKDDVVLPVIPVVPVENK